MKYFWVALALMVLASCATADDGPILAEEFLVGQWYWQDELVNGKMIAYGSHEPCGKDYIAFEENQTFSDINIVSCEKKLEVDGEWELDGDKLRIAAFGYLETATILLLDEKNLHVKVRFDYDRDGHIDTVVQRFIRM
jgi:hypothetical protein